MTETPAQAHMNAPVMRGTNERRSIAPAVIVAAQFESQLFLHPGDTVAVEIERIGALRNRVADPV